MPGRTSATSSLMRPMPGIRSPSSRVGIGFDQRETTNASWAYASKIFACTTWPVDVRERGHVHAVAGLQEGTRRGAAGPFAAPLRAERHFGQLPDAEILGLQLARIEGLLQVAHGLLRPLSRTSAFNSRYLIALTIVVLLLKNQIIV